MVASQGPSPDEASSSPATVLQPLDGGALDPRVQPQCSLSVHVRRVTGAVIGRRAELAAVEQELANAASHFSAVTLEGEPGIGKTRLLLAAAEMAAAKGFAVVAVTADEEIHGPFLLAQSLFAAPSLREAITDPATEAAVRRVLEASAGRDEPGLETLSADAKLLRAFDLAAVAVAGIAAERPLAILIDDVQWADDDTLRMLRYVVRSDADRPIFLFLAIRPDEFAAVSEAVNFVADLERMGLVRRMRVGRLRPAETGEMVRQILSGTLDPTSAGTIHAQSEGVPFIVEELVRTYRDAGLLQQIDGSWSVARNAGRLVPSAVRTLIGRRAARLPEDSKAVLADAAILGRSFSLRDLLAVRSRADEGAPSSGELADALAPAVEAGLLFQHPEGAPADYTFTHEQVREFAAAELSGARGRLLHRALVDLMLESGEPAPASLPLLAQHALAAGDTERAARFSIEAARAALRSSAPEEALRLVERALPAAASPEDRRLLLTTRDDAYALVRRPGDRLEGLAELAALTEALRDSDLEFDVQLRRAAALRLAHDDEAAAELADRIRARAASEGNAAVELRANLELGQALTRVSLGESFGVAGSEVDLDAAEAAYRRVCSLAEELSDERSLAAALREIGTILVSRLRIWFGGQLAEGRGLEFAQRVTAGESVEALLASTPAAPLAGEAKELFERALGIYERLGDRTGVMSTVIAMAYVNYAPVIHITNSARHLEEIRRVTSKMTMMVTESERARQELQMLYGVQVYARAKVVPDLMLSRGQDAYRSARVLGDRSVEFLAAGGVALAHLELGEIDEAEAWLDRAAATVAASPTPTRALKLACWRGMVRAGAGDAAGMRECLDDAVRKATDQGRPAARCEALARLAIEAARLGSAANDAELLAVAERAAREVKEIHPQLPGHAPWGAEADAALSEIAMARGDLGAAAEAAGAAVTFLQQSGHEDMSLEILLPAARALLATAPPEMQEMVRAWLQVQLSRVTQGTADEEMRVRWLRGPVGRTLVELAGPLRELRTGARTAGEAEADANLDDTDRQLLELLTQGSSNGEMAEALGLDEEAVAQRLARLIAGMGASTRAEATSLAFRGMAG